MNPPAPVTRTVLPIGRDPFHDPTTERSPRQRSRHPTVSHPPSNAKPDLLDPLFVRHQSPSRTRNIFPETPGVTKAPLSPRRYCLTQDLGRSDDLDSYKAVTILKPSSPDPGEATMALRFFLVSAVASLGLTFPEEKDVRTWAGCGADMGKCKAGGMGRSCAGEEGRRGPGGPAARCPTEGVGGGRPAFDVAMEEMLRSFSTERPTAPAREERVTTRGPDVRTDGDRRRPLHRDGLRVEPGLGRVGHRPARDRGAGGTG